MKMIADGQLALVAQHEAACRSSGEAKRNEYLQKMGMLCEQQRLLAGQLADAIRHEVQRQDLEMKSSM